MTSDTAEWRIDELAQRSGVSVDTTRAKLLRTSVGGVAGIVAGLATARAKARASTAAPRKATVRRRARLALVIPF